MRYGLFARLGNCEITVHHDGSAHLIIGYRGADPKRIELDGDEFAFLAALLAFATEEE